MTQEDKNLLLQDLCGRLPYGVKVNHLLDTKPSDLFAIDTYRSTLYCFRNGREEWYKVEFIKPYLRPMISMTDEEEAEIANIIVEVYDFTFRTEELLEMIPLQETFPMASIDWFYKKGFDIRGLITKGLALEAPEGMYNH